METKVCMNCNVEKSLTLDSFYKDKHKSDGFTVRCKECIKKQQNKRNRDEPERKKAESRKHYWKYREKILKNQKENRDDEYHKNYYLEHKEARKKYRKEYYENNKEQYFNRANKRRAQKLNQTPDYANNQLINLIYKHCPKGYDIDHMTPLVKGGLHHESNLCYLPANVNRSKGSKTIEEFGIEEFNEYVIYWQDVLPLG